jgi:exo-1,4-beta-D-glucosaminidase
MRRALALLYCLIAAFTSAQNALAPNPHIARVNLKSWRIQSGCRVSEKGDVISRPGFADAKWIPAQVPTTVLAAQVAQGIFKDPYYGMNLRNIPGTSYSIGEEFNHLPMPDDSPYKCPWWYRTEFRLPAAGKGKTVALHFDGINYRANIWLNGKQIASSNDVAGTYRSFEFPVTLVGGKNALAVEVFAPTVTDLSVNWVDWNPAPPDKDMGLWRDVWLSTSGPVVIRAPQVVSAVDTESLRSADLIVTAEVRNTTDKPVHGKLTGTIENTRFTQLVQLAANESKVITFAPDRFKQLHLVRPRLWWPWQMGSQPMYTLTLAFNMNGAVSDKQAVRFGIRQVTSEMTAQGARLFKINGKAILIRGGGWTPDMMLREDPVRLEQQIRYTRDMGLNTIRLEGKMESQRFYDLADRYGILVMAGWCCCDIWEQWKDWPAENHKIAVESLKSQMLNLRKHPSVFVWLNGSDGPPVPEVEQAYLNALKESNWANPVISSASQASTTVTGPSGVKMTGPYDWVPPGYWYVDKEHGGAYGFNTETSPGPAIPPVESLLRFIPKEHAWPMDQFWTYHAGLEGFTNIGVYTNAMNARYGAGTSIDDFAAKSQAMAYEGERAMFEAYSRNKYRSTGLIQWMLNNAWPSLIWHLYDYNLTPAGGYFGTKKATQPLHVVFGYDDRSVSVVNSTYAAAHDLHVTAIVYNFDLTEKYRKQAQADVAADAVTQAFILPEIPDLTPTYFVKLQLADFRGKLISDNFYWLSTRPDVYDWAKTDYTHTPTTQTGDMTALGSLGKVELGAQASLTRGTKPVVSVKLRNPSRSLAFMTRVRLLDAIGKDVLPIHWNDNFVSLLPGEQRELSATYEDVVPQPKGPLTIRVEGWNITPKTIPLVSGGSAKPKVAQ